MELAPIRELRTGAIAEAKAIAALLERGHRVAIPIVDDAEVDLVVNHRLAVQVKSAAVRSLDGRGGRCNSYSWRMPHAEHIDLLMLYAFDIDAWWIVPGHEARGLHRKGTISISPDRDRSHGGRPANGLDRFRDAWHLFAVA